MERKEPRFTGRAAMGLGRIKAEAQKGDAGKAPYHLLPPNAIHDVVLALEEGATKYGDHNWRDGTSWSRYLSAALRHIFAWMRGQDLDEESGKPHLAHAVCCLLFLLEYGKENIGTDDRPICKKAEHGPRDKV